MLRAVPSSLILRNFMVTNIDYSGAVNSSGNSDGPTKSFFGPHQRTYPPRNAVKVTAERTELDAPSAPTQVYGEGGITSQSVNRPGQEGGKDDSKVKENVTIECDAVVVTVPLPILQASTLPESVEDPRIHWHEKIKFVPPLPPSKRVRISC